MRRIARALPIALTLAGCVTPAPAPDSGLPGPPPPEASAAPPTASVERLADYLGRLEALGFSGAVIVEQDGEVVLREGYGLADRATRRPYSPETVQTHGSITKQVTAAAILLLESQGKLRVEDPITAFFAEVPADKQGITLHQLLTHSAGLPDAIGPDREPIGAEEFAARAFSQPLQFEPGTGQSYSNVGYSLLGIVVERVSGRGYEAFLRDELFLPAGLRDTGYLLPGWDEDRLAFGYEDGELWGRVYRREWRDDGPGWNLRANGGLHTTVDDMHRWLAVLRGKGPLPPAAVAKWTAPHVEEPGADHYGYGWEVAQTELGRFVGHNGGNGIFSADFLWLPDAGLFVYIQGNTSLILASQLREALFGALFDPDFTMPPAVATDDSLDGAAAAAAAAAREGVYGVEGGAIALTADDLRLVAALSGQPVLDAALGRDPALGERFAELNARAAAAMRRIEAGRDDAFEGLVQPDEDPAARAGRLLARLERAGGRVSLTLVGSVENLPGTRFVDFGPWATFFRAELPEQVQTWTVLWRADGTYRGTAIGPPSDLPSFVLVPTGAGAYDAVGREPPWRRTEFRFRGDCVVVGGLEGCR